MKERLKQIRESLKKTQKEMSNLLGLGDATWQNYERGTSNPKSDILKKLDDMGYSMSWIMLGVGSMLKDNVAESAQNGDFSSGTVGNTNLNIEKIFRAFLDEFGAIYAKQLTKLPKNFVEIMAFRKTLEVVRMADDLVMAFELMQRIVKNEIEVARITPPNERFKELID